MSEATMARPKKRANEPEARTVGVRASVAWVRWLEKYADFARTDVSKLIDRALAELAKADGFDDPPPKRKP